MISKYRILYVRHNDHLIKQQKDVIKLTSTILRSKLFLRNFTQSKIWSVILVLQKKKFSLEKKICNLRKIFKFYLY